MTWTSWTTEQVEAVAPSPAAVTAARSLATPTRWSGTGADERVLWGSCQGSGAEPYDTMVDHVGVGFRCTCPSRKTPCKHAIALLLLWAQGQVPPGTPRPSIESWISRRTKAPEQRAGRGAEASAPDESVVDAPAGDSIDPEVEPDDARPPDHDDRDQARDERVEKMFAGLTELDRWLTDRIRTGLADPALARYATWDDLASRLVDAQAGSLANRIRRLAGLVGSTPDWQDDVLAELGILHLLARAGRRLGSLPGPLADAVATSVGWQVRKAEVLGGVPDTDHWVVAGRGDQREDRIEVRRHWLRGTESGRWALVLSFAAYQQSLDTSLQVGTVVHADLHRYPGPALRALVGRHHLPPEAMIFPGEEHSSVSSGRPPALTVDEGCGEVGTMLIAEPWLDRVPTTMRASPARRHGRWMLVDHTGSVPLAISERSAPPGRGDGGGLAVLLALSGGDARDITCEWTPHGFVPLAVHLDDRSIDIGPRADASFVGSA
ncbi:MAG: SWIM zinc finger domain-containing protein [Ilumatobacter sp.]